MGGEPTLKAGDFIQIWIGVAASLTALFMWLTYRLQRGGFLLSVPHLSSWANDHGQQRVVNFALQGNGREQWEIAEVVIVSPRSVHLLETKLEYDAHGGGVLCSTGKPVGRRQPYSGNGVAISASDRDVKFRVKIALKAAPSVTSWRTARIKKKD